MRPKIILHNAVSADGRTTGLAPNLGLFYKIAGDWDADVTLAGSDTILAALRQSPDVSSIPPRIPARMAVSRSSIAGAGSRTGGASRHGPSGRPSSRSAPGLRRASILSTCATSGSTTSPPAIIGSISLALHELAQRYGARTIRVESGGTLNGALLRQNLVDEVSLLLHSVLVGGMSPHTIYRTVELAPDAPVEMKLHDCQMLDGDYAWLRYRVVK